jgi:hypothetical protein
MPERKDKMSLKMVRWGGWILLLGGVISLVATVLGFVIPGPAGFSGPPSNAVSVINLIAGVLLLLGLPAAYAAQSKQMGTLGLIGCIALWLTALLFDVVLGVIGIIVVSSSNAASLAGPPPPALFALFIVGTLLELIGGVLFGLRIIQTHVFANAIGWLLIIAVVLGAIGFPLQGTMSIIVQTASTVVLFVALGWLGYAVASQPVEVAAQPVG